MQPKNNLTPTKHHLHYPTHHPLFPKYLPPPPKTLEFSGVGDGLSGWWTWGCLKVRIAFYGVAEARDDSFTPEEGLSATTVVMRCYPLNDVLETIKEIGFSVRKVMGGTSGIIYDILFNAAYASLKTTSQGTITSKEWASALEAAIAAVSKYGGAQAGYRTLLDALIPASEVLRERLNAEDDPLDAFVKSSEAALSGAESTKHMQALVRFMYSFL
ncbi:hypothetical protein KSS87_017492 [Heliosperma pusillum]|nr:hypothetical protein KSS87_017492 [Heliosperma pusillum]